MKTLVAMLLLGSSIASATPTTSTALDAATIRRYVRHEIPQVKHCYEKELVTNTALAGTVTTKFVISPSGAVTQSEATGVSLAVSSCIADVMEAITFPATTGGDSVVVTYPFVLVAN